MSGALPRFFLADGSPPRQLPAVDRATVCELVDVLACGDARRPRQVAVVRDLGGELLCGDEATVRADPTLLPALIHAEFSRGGQAPRYLAARRWWTLAVSLVELPDGGDPIGAPVRLVGALGGPWPEGPAAAHEGALTVRRADWLRALDAGARSPLACASDPAEFTAALLLPGGGGDAIVDGRDLVLAYPLLPAGAALGNATVIAGMLRDALANLQAALQARGDDGQFATAVLPSGDRAEREASLRARGFTIAGDRAVKTGLFVKDEQHDLPPDATVVNLLKSSQLALAGLGAFPDELSRVLFGRVGRAPELTAPLDLPRAPPPPPPPRVERAERPRPRREGRPEPTWLADFADLPPPANGATITPKPARPDAPRAPDWLKDFE